MVFLGPLAPITCPNGVTCVHSIEQHRYDPDQQRWACSLDDCNCTHREQVTTVTVPVGRIIAKLRENGFGAEGGQIRQVLCLAEEVGEFVGAYRRWAGMARRQGFQEDVEAELADVVITSFVAAEELDIDLEQAVARKLEKIFARPWRDDSDPEPVAPESTPGGGEQP